VPKLQRHPQTAGATQAKNLAPSVLLRIETNCVPCHECSKRPLRSLPSTRMAQGHPVLPPYGSGLGRERAVFPRYYRSRPSPLATQDLQLPVNSKNARGGCAYFRHSCTCVAIARCSLYELIAAVAWKAAGIDWRSEGLIAWRLSSGGATETNGAQKAGCPSEGDGRPAFLSPAPPRLPRWNAEKVRHLAKTNRSCPGRIA
jgi:hypothetical protein